MAGKSYRELRERVIRFMFKQLFLGLCESRSPSLEHMNFSASLYSKKTGLNKGYSRAWKLGYRIRTNVFKKESRIGEYVKG